MTKSFFVRRGIMENKNEFDFDMFKQEKSADDIPSPKRLEEKRAERKKRQLIVNICVYSLLGAIICAALILAAPFAFAKYNPERYARQYIEAVIAKDYGAIYDKSEGRSLASFTREEFIAACEANPQLISISDKEITSFAVQKYGAPVEDTQNMLVTFTNAEGETGVYIFPMLQISNGFWKYDEYAAVISFDIICHASIYAPRQTTVYINGEAINEELCEVKTAISPSGDSFTYFEYGISPMLAGTYTITAENSYCEPCEQSVEISKHNSDIYINLTLGEDGLQQLISAAKNNLTSLINAAAENSVDSSVLPMTERFTANGFEELAKSLEEELYAGVDYISVSDFEISDISAVQKAEGTGLNALDEPRVTLDLTFDYTYKLNNSGYSAEGESRNGTGYAIITYTLANGKWQLDDLALQAKF